MCTNAYAAGTEATSLCQLGIVEWQLKLCWGMCAVCWGECCQRTCVYSHVLHDLVLSLVPPACVIGFSVQQCTAGQVTQCQVIVPAFGISCTVAQAPGELRETDRHATTAGLALQPCVHIFCAIYITAAVVAVFLL